MLIVYNEYKKNTFAKRLAIMLGCDIALTVVDAYIPHDLSIVRGAMAFIVFACIAVTMAVVARNVLEDF